jgi:hypothetical protein
MADELSENLGYLSFENRLLSGGKLYDALPLVSSSNPGQNVYGAQELTPRNEFRQPM